MRAVVVALGETLFRPYSQILLSRRLSIGALMLGAIACYPRMAVATVGTVCVAALSTLALGLGSRAVREGVYGCSAVLTTLALGAFAPDGGPVLGLMAVGALLAVFVTAATEAVLSTVALPCHALPFVFTTWLVHLASRSLPANDPIPWQIPAGVLPASWLAGGRVSDMFASIAFVHGLLPGLLVVGAILLHSRIAFGLAAAGAATAMILHTLLRDGLPWSTIDATAGFNAILTAMALGGFWFVPHPTASLLGIAAAAVSTVLTYAAFPALAKVGLPVLSLPFGLVVPAFLAAARQRLVNRAPRSALPADTPEETLRRAIHETRRAGGASIALGLPFRGMWYVSQGHDGAHTHRELWRHGLDFESLGPDGRTHERDGRVLTDYYAYGLPVLSAAPGTVVLIVDGIADNQPGRMDFLNNWGNAVVVAHGLGLYSVYAHLQPGTLRVKVGAVVAAGTELGRCGNSGRSSTPHLHFQMQRAAALGSPTIAAKFCHFVASKGGQEVYHRDAVPTEGQQVRPVLRDEAMSKALGLVPGMRLRLTDSSTGREEAIRVELDLFGGTVLKSARAALTFELLDWGFLVSDFRGSHSMLLALAYSFGRVPVDRASLLQWHDRVPLRFGLSTWARALDDLVEWFVPGALDREVQYSLVRQTGALEIRGLGKGWSTHATLSLCAEPHRIEITFGGRAKRLALSVDASGMAASETAPKPLAEPPSQGSPGRVRGETGMPAPRALVAAPATGFEAARYRQASNSDANAELGP